MKKFSFSLTLSSLRYALSRNITSSFYVHMSKIAYGTTASDSTRFCVQRFGSFPAISNSKYLFNNISMV